MMRPPWRKTNICFVEIALLLSLQEGTASLQVLHSDLVLTYLFCISDTVASTLISIFFHLADDPSQADKLRAELEGIDSVQDISALQSKAHLNGVINEALRLHPALPSGGFRETPIEGINIAGQYIPGNVVVSAPRYSLGRREC